MGWVAPVTWAADIALSVARLNEQLRDNLLYLYGLRYYKRQAMWFIAGNQATGATQSATIVYRGPAGTIVKADAVVETAPLIQNLIVDIHLNGATIWTTQANRLAIAFGATAGNTATFDVTAVADGDVFTLDIDQVGTGTVGADLTVLLQIKCPLEAT